MIRPIQGGKFKVMVASRKKLASTGKCIIGTQMTLQGIPIWVGFYLLLLEVKFHVDGKVGL